MSTTWIGPAEAAQRMGISRTTLDAMLARAPSDLPGSPVLVGVGTARRHLRWDEARIEEWLVAYRAWASGTPAQQAAPASPARRRATQKKEGGRRPSLLSLVTGGRSS